MKKAKVHNLNDFTVLVHETYVEIYMHVFSGGGVNINIWRLLNKLLKHLPLD